MDKMNSGEVRESGGKDEIHSEFYNTGRIGRRNALPDILGTHCTTTTADLPSRFSALTTTDTSSKPTEAGSSGINNFNSSTTSSSNNTTNSSSASNNP